MISRKMASDLRGAYEVKSRFSEERRVTILGELDRAMVAEAAKKHKVSEPMIYIWPSTSARWKPMTA
jgi:hypothetical protein